MQISPLSFLTMPPSGYLIFCHRKSEHSFKRDFCIGFYTFVTAVHAREQNCH